LWQSKYMPIDTTSLSHKSWIFYTNVLDLFITVNTTNNWL
jgi:hypothetical protein